MEHPFESEIKMLTAKIDQITAESPIIVQNPLAVDIYKHLSYPSNCNTDKERAVAVQKRIDATIETENLLQNINDFAKGLVKIAKEKADSAKGTPQYEILSQEYSQEDSKRGFQVVNNNKLRKSLQNERASLEEMQAKGRFI